MDNLLEKEYSLFISLGYDFLYSINLNQIRSNKDVREKDKLEEVETEEAELELAFSHFTHTQPDRSYYPLGMGLFVHNSNFHFFGGQNLKNSDLYSFLYDGNDILKKQRRDHPMGYGSSDCSQKEVFNKKVFSFTPNFPLFDHSDNKPTHITRLLDDDNSLSDHNSIKVRPIMFTIGDKVYAFTTKPYLATRSAPYSPTLSAARETEPNKELNLFEVFDPDNNTWKKLSNPPLTSSKYEAMMSGAYFPLIRSCVCNNKFFTQILDEQYIFDTKEGKWFEPFVYPPELDMYFFDMYFFASLEYKDHLLVLSEWGNSYDLVAYPKSSFENPPWKFGESYTSILLRLDDDIERRGRDCQRLPVLSGSLSLVENNHICLVYNRMGILNICLLEVNTEATVATVEAHQKFIIPDGAVLYGEEHTMSTFIFQHDSREKKVGKSNQGSNEKRVSEKLERKFTLRKHTRQANLIFSG